MAARMRTASLGALLTVFSFGCTADVDGYSVDDQTYADEVANEPFDVTDHVLDTDPATADPPALARIRVLRGTDRAIVLTTTQAKRLKNDHGVRWTGVYIGGPCNGGSGWTKSRVTAISQATHWRFMPIYVGQQSSSI